MTTRNQCMKEIDWGQQSYNYFISTNWNECSEEKNLDIVIVIDW